MLLAAVWSGLCSFAFRLRCWLTSGRVCILLLCSGLAHAVGTRCRRCIASLPQAPTVVWCFVARRRTRPRRLPRLLTSVLFVRVAFCPSRLVRECIALWSFSDLVWRDGVSVHLARRPEGKGMLSSALKI